MQTNRSPGIGLENDGGAGQVGPYEVAFARLLYVPVPLAPAIRQVRAPLRLADGHPLRPQPQQGRHVQPVHLHVPLQRHAVIGDNVVEQGQLVTLIRVVDHEVADVEKVDDVPRHGWRARVRRESVHGLARARAADEGRYQGRRGEVRPDLR